MITDNKLSFLIALGVHLVLLFISYFVVFENPVKDQKKIEIIEFQAGSNSTKKEIKKQVKNFPKKINLPESFNELGNEEIFETEKANTEKISGTAEKIVNDKVTVDGTGEIDNFEEVERESNYSEGVLDNDYLSSLESSLEEKENENRSYLLEGEIKDRKIVEQVIPKYPQDLSLNGIVKIQFNVNAQGNVKNIVVLKKSHYKFENNAIDALKQWKFNEVSSKRNQTGIITFFYELE